MDPPLSSKSLSLVAAFHPRIEPPSHHPVLKWRPLSKLPRLKPDLEASINAFGVTIG